jgi:hypothetical protein
MAGVIATLEHASVSHGDTDCDDDYANLAESAHYRGDGDGDPNDVLTAGEQFPAMIAEALRKLVQPFTTSAGLARPSF